MSFQIFSNCFFVFFFFFNDTPTTEIYTSVHTLSLHDALPISRCSWSRSSPARRPPWHRARSEEHTSELQSRTLISYAVFCLKKKKNIRQLIEGDSINLNKNPSKKEKL